MRYFFENYVLDVGCRELRCSAALVPVTPQVFDILEYLIHNRDRLVSKDDLIVAVWNGRIISDSALTTRLNAVRQAIGDSGDVQHFIKTLTGKGYRFVGSVREERTPGSLALPDIPSGSSKSAPRHLDNPSIAVLPFANISGRLNHVFLADAVAEDVLTELAKLRWLFVVARNSSFAYRQKSVDVRQIGRELGVRYVLEGSVRDAGSLVHVTGRLVDARTGMLIWIGRYDLRSAEILANHDDVIEAMAAETATAIVTAERQRAMQKSRTDLGVWEAYQRGMWHMSQCELAENTVAQSFFQHAIDLDPNYAAGHGALGWSYMMAASIYSQMTIADGCALAEPLVRGATALDGDDLESRARLAISAMLQGDLEGAFDAAQQVLSVNENCGEALGVKGTALLYSGRRPEGRKAIEQHLRLSPRDPARPIRLSQIAASLYLDGNYEAAVRTARQVIRQYPKHPTAHRWLAASLGQLGRVAEAEEVLHHLQTKWPSSFDMYIRQRPQYCSIEYAPLLAGLRKAGWTG